MLAAKIKTQKGFKYFQVLCKLKHCEYHSNGPQRRTLLIVIANGKQTLPSSCYEKHLAGTTCMCVSQSTQAGAYTAISIITGLLACK